MASTIVHFEIPNDDVPALQKFYQNVFDWNIVNANMGDMEYWLVNTVPQGEHGVSGGMMQRMPGQNGILAYVGVDSVDQISARTTQLGGSVLQPKIAIPGVGYSAVVQDPQGNVFVLFQSNTTVKG